ncbi:hypothetical protein [Brucella gallinifaecis]|uniref:hypothetical protein n=1 Tax=Brucella gallinifaecis TaxID=215590 RepID=UPI002361EEE7|nr:hypothetical protein [Brucella gallinifaecis]
MAELFGMIIGGMIPLYLIGKLIELPLRNKVIENKALVYFGSSLSIFVVFFILFLFRDPAMNQSPVLMLALFLAAIILPLIRLWSAKRKEAQKA